MMRVWHLVAAVVVFAVACASNLIGYSQGMDEGVNICLGVKK